MSDTDLEAILQDCCAAGALSVHSVGLRGDCPIHVAAARGVLHEIRTLRDAGAGIDAQEERGDTPLHRAAGQGHVDAVRELLSLGADMHVKNSDGLAPEGLAELLGKAGVSRLTVAISRADQGPA